MIHHPAAVPAIDAIPDVAAEVAGLRSPKRRRAVDPSRRVPVKCFTPRMRIRRIYKLSLDGKVLGVLGESGKQLKQFGWIHEIACPSENVLYVAELLNWRIQKLILHP
jgi:hypothetical protein